VFRIDTGMSSFYVGGDPAVLEISGDAVRAITAAVPARPAGD
jgi:hypothetical protein